ncbi:MAG TPA: O-antigen ligase family protein [Anaerolineales bacterium]|nr:O-antigen ligase family protein [Anaerolineales bacterium]
MIGKKSLPVLLLSDRFALLEVGLVLVAGGLWYAMPELGPWPLGLALAPWVLRMGVGRLPFRRTSLDLFFLIFLATALVGVWAAYDRERALAKFWLILDGVLLFLALAAQPRGNLWRLAWGFGGFAVVVSLYYFLTHNWELAPAKIDGLNRIGLAWMDLRPAVTLRALHPNVAAGLAAMSAPFLVAVTLREWASRRAGGTAAAAGLLGFVLFAILMTTSRGAWLALAAAMLVWLLWGISGLFARYGRTSRGTNFLTFLSILVVFAGFVIFTTAGGLIGLADALPGPSHTGSRLDLMRGMSYLISDFPFTGGGLDAFPGLYGQYILVSPFYIVEHGHNLFLDVSLEQGLFGGLALIAIFGIAFRQIGRTAAEDGVGAENLLLAAALAGMLVVVLHGLMDDALYGSRAQFLMWAAPGFGMAVYARRTEPEQAEGTNFRTLAIGGVTVLVLLVYVFIFRDALSIVWRTNLAAVEMARIELADFPTGEWDDGSEAGDLTPPAAEFEAVIRENPGNQTARFRLGQIGLLIRNFEVAVEHLEVAYQSAPGHPGIRKSLAYAYVWTDRAEEGLALMADIPDVDTEMRNYTGWWRSQGRGDLAVKAETILTMIGLGQ